MNEIQRLKTTIKRRDDRITQLKEDVKERENTVDYLREEVDTYRMKEEEFKQALIKFLNLDDYIRDVVRGLSNHE